MICYRVYGFLRINMSNVIFFFFRELKEQGRDEEVRNIKKRQRGVVVRVDEEIQEIERFIFINNFFINEYQI